MTISRFAAAFVVPVAVFGILYVVAVRPQRAGARLAQHQLEQSRARVTRAPIRERKGDGTAAHVKALLDSPAVGGVRDLSFDKDPEDVKLTFDARPDQIGRFFWTLPTLPAFDVRSLELSPGAEGLVHVTVALRAHKQDDRVAAPLAESGSEPRWSRNPFTQRPVAPPKAAEQSIRVVPSMADPIVSGIVVSGGRRLAVVNDRIVGPGDVLGTATVRSIEPEAVVIAGPDGRPRRVPVRRPVGASTGPM